MFTKRLKYKPSQWLHIESNIIKTDSELTQQELIGCKIQQFSFYHYLSTVLFFIFFCLPVCLNLFCRLYDHFQQTNLQLKLQMRFRSLDGTETALPNRKFSRTFCFKQHSHLLVVVFFCGGRLFFCLFLFCFFFIIFFYCLDTVELLHKQVWLSFTFFLGGIFFVRFLVFVLIFSLTVATKKTLS